MSIGEFIARALYGGCLDRYDAVLRGTVLCDQEIAIDRYIAWFRNRFYGVS